MNPFRILTMAAWVSLLVACATSPPVTQPPNLPILEDLFVRSDLDRASAELHVLLPPDLAARLSSGGRVQGLLSSPDGSTRPITVAEVSPPDSEGYTVIPLALDPLLPWHPKTPSLYRIQALFFDSEGNELAAASTRFGVRKLETRDARFYVNNQPFYVRACGGEGGCGCDNLDRAALEKRLRAMRQFGFNAVRHHTHVPGDLYLDVADEVGIFVQMESGGKQIGDDPDSERFAEWNAKWIDTLRRGRRHPSTFIYSVGNEVYLVNPGLLECLGIFHDQAKSLDPTALFLNRSGSNPFNDAYGEFDLIERPIGEYEHVGPLAREAFELYLRGDRKGRSDEFPILAHEYPLVASYPNPALASKYEEVPPWIATTVEKARENGLEHLLPTYVENTERLQAICRKEMLEEARKFPELDGYSMLRFVDCAAYVSGVVDDFADPKNVTAEQFLRTNGETVLLCTWNERNLQFGDTLDARLQISHHGPETFTAPRCRWWVLEGPRVLAEGEFRDVKVGPVEVAEIGRIAQEVPRLSRAAKLTIRAELPGLAPRIENEWNVWAFPAEVPPVPIQEQILLWDPAGRMSVFAERYPGLETVSDPDWEPDARETRVILTDRWAPAFYGFLDRGGRILVVSDHSWPWPEEVGIFGLHITRFDPERQAPPVFPEFDEPLTKWLTICSNAPSRYGNSGTVIYPHPLLDAFPHEGFCDLQFWPMIYRAKSLDLARFPEGTVPVIRTIDNFYRGRGKGYMAELAAGEGKVFVCTLNLVQSLPHDSAARFFADQLIRYVTGDVFKPAVKVSTDQLRGMLEDVARDIAENPPEPLDELGARYETLWKSRLVPGELVVLRAYDAGGIQKDRLGIHYEYAQTQYYYEARPDEEMAWTFENKTDGDFAGTLYFATPRPGVAVEMQVDDHEPLRVTLPSTREWNRFGEAAFRVASLEPGEHELRIRVLETAGVSAGENAVRIRDVELRRETE